MHFLIIGVILILLIFGPQWWARSVLRHYSKPRPDYPGNGAQFARHLLNKFDMDRVRVEATEQGDHYDPVAKVVRLTPDKLNGKSLTAITVAAHEVGHAIQDHLDYAPLKWRARLVNVAQAAERIGSAAMMIVPVVALITRSPVASAAMFAVGIGSMAIGTVVHLITLPVEWDASFGRALPLLKAGQYLEEKDQKAARRILKACALTYFASSLASLLNVWRWLRFWRR